MRACGRDLPVREGGSAESGVSSDSAGLEARQPGMQRTTGVTGSTLLAGRPRRTSRLQCRQVRSQTNQQVSLTNCTRLLSDTTRNWRRRFPSFSCSLTLSSTSSLIIIRSFFHHCLILPHFFVFIFVVFLFFSSHIFGENAD